jgi:hypothetical protein
MWDKLVATNARHQDAVALAHERGVTIAMGTDVSLSARTGRQPGATTPRELPLLVEAGLTPLEAIEATATANAPATLGPERRTPANSLAGYDADVITVNGDPWLSDAYRAAVSPRAAGTPGAPPAAGGAGGASGSCAARRRSAPRPRSTGCGRRCRTMPTSRCRTTSTRRVGTPCSQRCRELDDDVPAALLIGHNPGVAALVHELTIQDTPVVRQALSGGFPPGALAELVVPVPWRELGWATCRLTALHRPGRRSG